MAAAKAGDVGRGSEMLIDAAARVDQTVPQREDAAVLRGGVGAAGRGARAVRRRRGRGGGGATVAHRSRRGAGSPGVTPAEVAVRNGHDAVAREDGVGGEMMSYEWDATRRRERAGTKVLW